MDTHQTKNSAKDNSMPLVSVAIIIYNQKEYLRQAIESALMQDYDNIEIIIADDASTDGSRELCLEYEKLHPGKILPVLATVNLGITANCNAAFSKCRGKYIAWLGGDDVMEPNKIRLQVEHMEKNAKCSISFHNVDVFDSATGLSIRLFNGGNTPKIGTLETVLEKKTYNCACSTMTRRADCPRGGFDTSLPVASDWKFWIETLSGGGEIHYIDQVLGRYRRHRGNVTRPGSSGHMRSHHDHLNTITWAIVHYPKYSLALRIALAETIRQMRWITESRYYEYTRLSVSIKPTWRGISGLIIYYISFGHKRL